MLHQKLEEINKKLDSLALQKRLEIEAEHLKRIKCTKFIRLFCSFTDSGFKVNTNIMNEIANEDKVSFWDVVRRFCICVNSDYTPVDKEMEMNPSNSHSLDASEDIFGQPEIFEWTRDSKTDGFFIPLNSKYKKIQLMVKLANHRNVYKLNKKLARLFNTYSDEKHNIIKEFYKYTIEHKLNNYVSSNITCNRHLEDLFNVESFNFNNISDILEPYFEPLPYCCIDIEIGKNEIWDIEIETDDLSQMPVLYPNVVQHFEKKIEETRILKNKIKDRIQVLEEFSENPSLFISRKIALDSESMGVKTAFFDNLNVQTELFELIKHKDQ